MVQTPESELMTLIKNAQGLSTVGSASQIQSILAPIAKSALIINSGVEKGIS